MDDFLTKPVQLDELVAALNCCRVQGAGEGSERAVQPVAPPAPMPAPAAEPVVPPAQAAAPLVPEPLVFDPAALQRLRATLGKQADALLPTLIDRFAVEAPNLMAEARRSLDENRTTDLKRAAHTLKGNSATLGAMALSALARELEFAARDNALDGAGELLARIQSAYDEALPALQAWRGTPKE
jgi:HPt (histidine-containing phosphotransfer) domain-containing protein